MASFFRSGQNVLKSVLDAIVKSRGWDEKLLIEKIPGIWNEIVGDVVSRASKVKKFEDGVLFVETVSSTWRAELLLRKNSIKNEINKRLMNDVVKEVNIR